MQYQLATKLGKRGFAVLVVTLLMMLVISQAPVSAVDPPPSDLNVGPYVDRLTYKVIANQDQRVLALQSGEIEMDNSFFDPVHLPTLTEDTDIDIYSALRNGYGHITINCRDYPLNISGLRRAFAYAFDKERVTVEVMDGFSQEHDSLVPYANGWCVEDEFDWHYYTDQSDIGNQILDDLGFEINEISGFRLAPNGQPFEIVIGYTSSSSISGDISQIGVDALTALNIDARMQPTDYNDGVDEYAEGIVDMTFYAQNFYSNDVDWLAYEYWSEYADDSDAYLNPTNFRNYTYDAWRDQLLYGISYEDIFEAAAEMQKILHYNVPRLVVYMNTYMQGYRNDRYTGHVEDLARYISGPWTMRKIQKIDGTFGGTVPIAISDEPDSFNIFVTNSVYSAAILSNLYSSLYSVGPDLNPWPDLATSMYAETNSDNPAVHPGHTKFTFDIIQNATWSDGTPLTADDVAFTFTYLYESSYYENPAGQYIGDLAAAYAPTPYRAVIEFNTESYWHFGHCAFEYIIPKHIFNDDTGIGYEDWSLWNPVLDPSEPHVTCGPYRFADFELGEYYSLTYNPTYHYRVPGNRPIYQSPVITHIPDSSYTVGTTGNVLTWIIDDDNPDTYQITMNYSLRESGDVNSSTISHNIDNLPIGNYTFTLTVYDESGNSGTSTTHVSVVESIGIGTGWEPVVTVLAISVSSVSVVIILVATNSIYRTKRIQSSTIT